MTKTTTRPNQMAIDDYVEKCEPFLTDLEGHQQTQVLDDIREIVTEVAFELEGDPQDLVGPPIRFVSDLRAAAGLPPLLLQARPDPSPPQRDIPLTELLSELVRKAVVSARGDAVPFTRELLVDLRPAWWVARGLGLAFLLGRITDDYSRPQGLFPNLFGSSIAGLLSAVALVVLSVRAGRSSAQRSPFRRVAWAALSVLSIVTLLSVSNDVRVPDAYMYQDGYAEPVPPLPAVFEGPGLVVTGSQFEFVIHSGSETWEVQSRDEAHEMLAQLEQSGYPGNINIEDEFGLNAFISYSEAHEFIESMTR